MRDCICTGPGFCERHQVVKSAHWVHLCQTRDNYWQAWEEGRGPGQRPYVGAGQILTDQRGGPGTELRKLLGRCCGCSFASRMNDWGPDLCLERIDTIIGWLCEDGEKKKSPISAEAARRLIVLAVEQSRLKIVELGTDQAEVTEDEKHHARDHTTESPIKGRDKREQPKREPRPGVV